MRNPRGNTIVLVSYSYIDSIRLLRKGHSLASIIHKTKNSRLIEEWRKDYERHRGEQTAKYRQIAW